jgi:predicted nucleic acid-binding Zn ribbon protein
MLGLDLEVTYNYRCLRCQHEDEVPDVVVDGFIASASLQPGRMPRLVCPECGGPFRAVVAGSSRERSER